VPWLVNLCFAAENGAGSATFVAVAGVVLGLWSCCFGTIAPRVRLIPGEDAF
jgi:hypothetical protein